jgi:hypothetical protein
MAYRIVIVIICVQLALGRMPEYEYDDEVEVLSKARKTMIEMSDRRSTKKNEAPASRPFQEVKIPGLLTRYSSTSSSTTTTTTTPMPLTTTRTPVTRMSVQDQFYKAAMDIIPEQERRHFGLFTLDDMHALREAERKMVFDAVKEHMHELHLSAAVEREVLAGVDRFREEPVTDFTVEPSSEPSVEPTPELVVEETSTVTDADPPLTVEGGSEEKNLTIAGDKSLPDSNITGKLIVKIS